MIKFQIYVMTALPLFLIDLRKFKNEPLCLLQHNFIIYGTILSPKQQNNTSNHH